MNNVEPINHKGEPHGLWIKYYSAGTLRSMVRYVNGEICGICDLYSLPTNRILYKAKCSEDFRMCYSEWYSDEVRIEFEI